MRSDQRARRPAGDFTSPLTGKSNKPSEVKGPDSEDVIGRAIDRLFATTEDFGKNLLGFFEGITDLLQWFLLAFFLIRFLAWGIRRAARAGRPFAGVVQRFWPLIEVALWGAVVLWVLIRLEAKGSAQALPIIGVLFLGFIALSWGAIKDMSAGLFLAAERSFQPGDYVRFAEVHGQVKAFRARALEIATPDGNIVRIPYRSVIGTTKVRKGGRLTAHAVTLGLELPDSIDPTEALKTARELALSSPWSVLGITPRLELKELPGAGFTIEVEAYAFDQKASALLHADLLKGWREAVRKTTPTKVS